MTESDFDRTARLWLEDGPTVLSDRALQAALDEIHVTPQHRTWWQVRRAFDLHISIRLAVGAAAVVLVAVLAATFLPGEPGVGGGPAETPTPGPTPTPTPIALPLNPQTLVISEPGTYAIGDPFPIPITITVPSGWSGTVGGPYAAYLDKDSGYAVIAFSLSQSVYADPCDDQAFLDPPPGPAVGDLVTALAALPGLDDTIAADVTVDGYRGKQLVLTLSGTVFDGCTLPSEGYRLWQLPLGAIWTINPGQRRALWILDVDGERLVVSADTFQATTSEEVAEVQGILDSIRIRPTN